MKKLKYEELHYLNMLLKTNMSISEGIKLIKNEDNKVIYDDILKRLNNGEEIERIFSSYVSKEINVYLIPLLKKLSFTSSLELSLNFYMKVKTRKDEIIKKCAYPLGLLFVCLTALYLFDLYGIDTIFNLLKSFNANISLYSVLRVIIRFSIYVFYFGLLFISILFLYLTRPKNISLAYIQFTKLFKNSIIKEYYSLELISLYLICLESGYKTKDSIEILKSLRDIPVISLLAFHLDEALCSGDSLKDAASQNYYDELLNGFIKIASYTNDFNSVMKNYIELTSTKLTNKLKRLTNIIQTSIYLLVGMLVIFVYQVLYLPMQAITLY